jgi:nucleoid-associated protein YgaU
MDLSHSISPYEFYGTATPVEDSALVEHLFIDGETLSGLAHRYYEDWRQWRLIADRNDVIDPRQIVPGTILLIPERPLERGIFESF